RMMVSAYATGLRLTLATVAAKDRNEVEAALDVVGLLDLKGKIVTADALHCNRKMVEAVCEKGGDYCIGLKGNQDSLVSECAVFLAKADDPKAKKKHSLAKTEDSGHGRSETRVAIVVEAKGLAEYHEFPGLTAFGRIEATRIIDGKTETDVRIFVLSRKLTAKALLETGRYQSHMKNRRPCKVGGWPEEDAGSDRKHSSLTHNTRIRRDSP